MEEEKKNPYADIKEFLTRWDVLKKEATYSRITILALTVLLIIMFFFVKNKKTVVTIVPYTLSSEAYNTQATFRIECYQQLILLRLWKVLLRALIHASFIIIAWLVGLTIYRKDP